MLGFTYVHPSIFLCWFGVTHAIAVVSIKLCWLQEQPIYVTWLIMLYQAFHAKEDTQIIVAVVILFPEGYTKHMHNILTVISQNVFLWWVPGNLRGSSSWHPILVTTFTYFTQILWPFRALITACFFTITYIPPYFPNIGDFEARSSFIGERSFPGHSIRPHGVRTDAWCRHCQPCRGCDIGQHRAVRAILVKYQLGMN